MNISKYIGNRSKKKKKRYTHIMDRKSVHFFYQKSTFFGILTEKRSIPVSIIVVRG